MPDYEFGFGQDPFIKYDCPVQNCRIIRNHPSLTAPLSDYNAVIFHMYQSPKNREGFADALTSLKVNDTARNPLQRYVMFIMESAINWENFRYANVNGFFNWTMTYRADSDIPRPYGWVEPAEKPFVYPTDQRLVKWGNYTAVNTFKTYASLLKKKTKKVAWIVSRCHSASKRESYVNELKKYIEVDVMGGCGTKCSNRNHRTFGDNCTAAVDEKYKFYLSFENSICDDYVTEKFFYRFKLMTVPVVLGGTDYSRIAPPHSYIDVRDFDTPKELAAFLLRLDENDEEYLAYFWWRSRYKSRFDLDQKAKSMCLLCAKLNDPDEPAKVYSDMRKWWLKDSNCKVSYEVMK